MDHEQKLIELANKVEHMRLLQKEFFRQSKTASQYQRVSLIHQAKKAETEVDEAVEKILHPKPTQERLF